MAENQRVTTLKEELDLLKVRNDVLKEFNSEQDMLNEKLRIEASFADQLVAKLSEQLANSKKSGKAYEEQVTQLKEAVVEQQRLTGQLERQNKALEKQKKIQGDIDDLTATTAGNFENLAQQMGILESNTSPFVAQFKSFGKVLSNSVKDGKGLGDAFKAFGRGAGSVAGQVFSFSNILGLTVNNALETKNELIAADQQLVSFGLSADRAKQLTAGISQELIRAGGTAADAATAFATLTDTSSRAARQLGPEFANRLALLAKNGLDVGSASTVLSDALVKEGLSAAEAQDRLGDLVQISRDLGEPVGKAAQEFVQFGSRIKAIGPAAVKEFAKLKQISEATGVSLGKLFDIGERFDTFSEAAQAAQQLNIVLGAQISGIELQRMSQADRIKTIQEAIRAQGGLNNLDASRIRLLEQTVGLNISEIMGMQNEVTGDSTDTTRDNTAALSGLEQQNRKVMGAQEAAMNATKAATLEMGKTFKTISQDVASSLNNISTTAIQFGIGLAAAIGGAISLFTMFGGTFTTLGLTAPAAGAGILAGGIEAGAGLAAIGAGGTLAIPVLLSLALVFGTIAAVVGTIAFGIFKVAEGIGMLLEKAQGVSFTGMAGFARFASNVTEVVEALNDASLPAVREMTALVNATTTTATGVGAGGGGGDITVNLTLDGRVIDRKILRTVNGALTAN